MKHQKYGAYLAAGVTAFAVIAAAILLFFVIYHFSAVRALLELLAYILRPIFYGLVLAFLLLPVHRQIYSFLAALCEGVAERGGRKRAALNFLAIVLSLIFAVLVVYVLLAMVLPQLYLSIVGLVNAVPEYIRIMQRWLLDFLADNPEIQAAVLPYYNSLAQSVEQWLSSDMLPNLESVNSTLDWLKAEILPQLTGVVSSVSSGVIALALLLKDILIAIIVSVYLLARKDVFAAQSKKIVYSVFRTNVADLLVEETRSAYRILSGFINGKLVDSLIIGIIGMPASLLFDPDSFYYGVLPVLAQTAEGFGVAGVDVGRAAILGQMTIGFPVSPLTASTFLLVGLSGVDFGEHQKKTIPLAWLVSLVMVVVAILTRGIAI